MLLSRSMRWSAWSWWLGAAAASLAVGASLLIRPGPKTRRAPTVAPVAPGTSKPLASIRARTAAQPAPPRLVTTPAPSAPHAALAIARDTLPIAALVEPTPSSTLNLSPPTAGASSAAASTTPKTSVGSPRRASSAALADWSKPGLCTTAQGAEAMREQMTASFRRIDDEAHGEIHLDPRLPESAESALLPLLDQARTVVAQQLGLRPAPPPVFVYRDQQLMKAAACINEDVVAFYDGALHLVADRADLQESVTHELTHHALFGSGLRGPAWAQEGIAMLVARETWWRAPAHLQALSRISFSPEQMEELIPYKLPAEQAVGFYVQSALTVQCLLTRRQWTMRELAETLRSSSDSDAVTYDLPELQLSSFVSGCALALGRL